MKLQVDHQKRRVLRLKLLNAKFKDTLTVEIPRSPKRTVVERPESPLTPVRSAIGSPTGSPMHRSPTSEGSASSGASVDFGDLEEKKEERPYAPSKKLYVGNIPQSENDFDIRALFEKFGIVTDFYRKKDNGQVSVFTNSNL